MKRVSTSFLSNFENDMPTSASDTTATPSTRPAPANNDYPLPYPPSYPPVRPPGPPPPARRWTPDLPHRYAVCRHCSTILLVLPTLPPGADILRHFSDDIPLSVIQTVPAIPIVRNGDHRHKDKPDSPDEVTPVVDVRKAKKSVSFFKASADPPVHLSAALSWLRRPFVGLLSYDSSSDVDQSMISLSCRNCRSPTATLLLTYGAREDGQEEGNSCARLSFGKWTVLLADAYGREIEAAPEILGFWASTPAPFAARPWRP